MNLGKALENLLFNRKELKIHKPIDGDRLFCGAQVDHRPGQVFCVGPAAVLVIHKLVKIATENKRLFLVFFFFFSVQRLKSPSALDGQ